MKQPFFLACIFLLAAGALHAQDRSLFGSSNNNRFGIFVSPLLERGEVFDDKTTSLGGGGGFVLGNGFIGAYGLASLNFEDVFDLNDVEEIGMAHGGLWLGYVPGQQHALHFYSSLKLGLGAIEIDTDNFDPDIADNILVVAPEAGLELNITKFLRLAGTIGYRWVDGVELADYNNKDFTGWTSNLALRIGYFGRNHKRHSCSRWD